MGGKVAELVAREPDLELVGGIERTGHPSAGSSLVFSGKSVRVFEGFSAQVPQADLLVDFTSPAGNREAVAFCLERKMGLVSGTTGLAEKDVSLLRDASKKIPVLLSPNMSTGVTLLARVLPCVLDMAGPQCDVEIVEKHHRAKKDSPSGTAIRVAEALRNSAKGGRKRSIVYSRSSEKADSRSSDIYVHSVRAGDIVGEHTVILGLQGERIEIKHVAESRDCFAFGTIAAVKFLAGRAPGWYTMDDVVAGT